ncbi:MAG: phenylalanine--tRNA ligase subunit beta [Burkholderiaceae bacterium]|nr:phenylalanine--tRNA ligase subunit beta [Burkholderiaceae bacterium]
MQFPESWLREFCNPPLDTAALADLLTMAGLEVEETRPVAPPFSGIVVAEILTAEPHPQADRLRVCTVSVGSGEPLQIVCGAPNARAGLKAPLAMVGAELPPGDDGKPFKIGIGKLRGVESRGMLCSAKELKLSDDHGGLLELAADAPVGTDIRAHLQLDDTLFTLKLTPNLAHALSVYGIAREVSALTGAPLKTPSFPPVPPTHDARLPVRVEAADLCGRFSGRIVRGVNTQAQTPAWMVDRLARCGQRSVSALVDISNYVMFEFGRPSHIFDLDKIEGELIVRWGVAGEQLELLNGNTVTVDEQVGVIADRARVESLAGIMGGEHTAVSDSTRNVYVEAAFWWPDAVAGRSRRYAFATDAGHRFERGVDPALTVEHIERITALIVEICGTPDTSVGPMDDQVLRLPSSQPVTLRVARAAKVIGMPLTQAQCAEVFRGLGLTFEEGKGTISVTPPSWRFDLKIEEDLIEEVARIVGYGKLPPTPPVAPVTARPQSEQRRSVHAVKHVLAALDYQETINFSFVEARWEHELAGNVDPIRVLNPIAAPLAVMRSSLMGSLVGVLRHNLARRASRVRVFETGRVFRRDPQASDGAIAVAGLVQPRRVAGLAWGPAAGLQWGEKERGVDFFDVKGDVEALLSPLNARFLADAHPALHPGRCAAVEVDGQVIGHVGELHPRWRQAYELPSAPILFELDLDTVLARPLPAPQPLPRQPGAVRDIALVVADTVGHDALISALGDDPLVRRVTLFDIYRPAQPSGGLAAGERSLALRLDLLDPAATLTDERIDAVVAAAVARAAKAHGARLRA